MSPPLHHPTDDDAGPDATVLALPGPTFEPGCTVALRLQPTRIVGRGTFGTVYEAHDPELDRTVAVKVAHPDSADALIAEARRAGICTHPHLLPGLGFGSLDGAPCFAMPFIAGGSLAALGDRPGRIDPRALASVVRQLGDALDALHAHGIVHRDVKPANVLLHGVDTATPHAYLADVGSGLSLARASDHGLPVGTLGFAAPEQLQGDHGDARTDVFGLGATLYWCLTGVYAHAVPDARIDVHTHRPDLDPALDAAIGTALATEPGARYATATEAAEAMARPLEQGARPTLRGTHLRVTTTPTPRRRWGRRGSGGGGLRRRVGVGAIAVAALAAAVYLGATAFGADVPRSDDVPAGDEQAVEVTETTTAPRSPETTALLALVPEPLRGSCTEATDATGSAGVQCRDTATDTTISYFRFADTAALDAWFAATAVADAGGTGTCADGRAARVNWRARRDDPEPAGQLRCAPTGTGAELAWTTRALRVGAVATGPLELPALWTWWQRTPGPVQP